MKYDVTYRDYKIIRDSSTEPYRIYKGGTLATEATFWNFGDARRECDALYRERRRSK